MKLLKKVTEILDKYNLEVPIPNDCNSVYLYLTVYPEKENEDFEHPTINDSSLYKKYEKYIPNGWYGFSIGNPTPMNWYDVLDNILSLLIDFDENLEIHQIKMKYGSICFYVESDCIEDIFDITFLIENKLFSKKLIY